MVSQAQSDSRKRKKTAEMPDSPPKRVTRARTRATEDSELGIKTTKITTASARIVAKTKPPAKTSTASKRKTKAVDAEPIPAEEALEEPQAMVAEPPKTRGRPKKVVQDTKEIVPTTEPAPKSRVRKTKQDIQVEESATQTTKPNTRTRRAADVDVVMADEVKPEVTEPEKAAKVTRTRAATTKAKTETTKTKATTRSTTKPAVPKKKVTFQDESQDDKENVAMPSETAKMVQPKPTGIRAKPVRKPTTAIRGGVRGKKSTSSKEDAENSKPQEGAPQPLSPKKVTQVAKSSSISSEDELCGERSPMRALRISPVKPPMSARKLQPTSAPSLDQAADPISPTKFATSSIMASPARRPPPSPFKDTFKESPRKVHIEATTAAPVLVTSLHTQGPLKQSPKKVNFGNTISTSLFAPSQTPLKASLLRSPARRPMSTFKPRTIDTPDANRTTVPATVGPSRLRDFGSVKPPVFTPSKVYTSSLRAEKSARGSAKIHRLISEDLESENQENDLQDQDQFVEHGNNAEENVMDQDTIMEGLDEPVFQYNPSMMLQSSPVCAVENTEATLPDKNVTEETTIENADKGDEHRSTTPPNEPTLEVISTFSLIHPAFRHNPEESDSEDELQSIRGVTRRLPLQDHGSLTPTPAMSMKTPKTVSFAHQALQRQAYSSSRSERRTAHASTDVSMTPLASQMSAWLASSPEKKNSRSECLRSIFSPAIPRTFGMPDQQDGLSQPASAMKSHLFEDEMLVRDQENATTAEGPGMENDNDEMNIAASQESQDSEEYGDENAVPIDPRLLASENAPQPALETVTPARIFQSFPREIHTVSKVPLRPEGDDSPLKVKRTRRRSVSGPLIDMKTITRPDLGRNNTVISYSLEEENSVVELPQECLTTPTRSMAQGNTAVDTSYAPATPSNDTWSSFTTPARSVRKGADAQILRGVVVFVDVHTTEGADASGIFVELLTQMGARCVKQWTWNPRSVSGKTPSPEQEPPPTESTPSGKVGITHVVFKDGGKRTLEKVRESKGHVLCVGVGWVLDCERENTWLHESAYAVDTSLVPRGGHRRRKSMEPRALANLNGSLVPSEAPAKVYFDLSPTKEFLNLSSPVRQPLAPATSAPETPKPATNEYDDGASSWGSPTTPYYLSKGAQLMQQTCPPKQTMQPLFPASGRIEDQPDEAVRQRLMLARRKSLQWAPKVGSPLGKAMTCAK
ncbi:hypothetical protein MMC30_002331 [Trapelia coarctata]|nr:hypothetical protein [Trapelia coarctata]